MKITDVIIKPIVTEKSTIGMEQNRYTFQVDRHADKGQIRRAIEELYSVRVVKVNTRNRRGEARRNRYGQYMTPTIKQAVVKIHEEDRIELF
ncbi:MAG: 50S ribosomal protein L23 [Planctomycetota bacterium]|nr:50S ribosomal protein L23 [Planctomycetota bacterium]